MSLQYIWLVRDCQLTSIPAETHSMRTLNVEGDFVTNLWEMTATAAGNQTLNLTRLDLKSEIPFGDIVLLATNSGDKKKLAEARQVAEETIALLRTQPTRKSDDTDGKTDLQIRKCKTKLSHAAHKACKALRDLDAAIGYLEDA
jgi:hypothetical protein